MAKVTYIKRKEEKDSSTEVPIRSNRFFKLGDHWYFSVRGGASVGPYNSHTLAEGAVRDYLQFMANAQPHALKLFERPNPAFRAKAS